MRLVKQLVGFFVALYIVLASQMLFVHSLLVNGKTLLTSPITQVNAATLTGSKIKQVLPIPTIAPTSTPTPSPTPTIVPVGDPEHMEIPKLGIQTKITRVGVTSDNTMQTPDDFSQVGWYTQGSRPGEVGAAIINGHYDNVQGSPAVFYNLSKLTKGDEIIINTSLGKQLRFTVISSYSQEYSSFPKELVYSHFDGYGLRLITCDGVWNSIEKTYSKRLVVNAQLQ